jgi:hypothetical protein
MARPLHHAALWAAALTGGDATVVGPVGTVGSAPTIAATLQAGPLPPDVAAATALAKTAQLVQVGVAVAFTALGVLAGALLLIPVAADARKREAPSLHRGETWVAHSLLTAVDLFSRRHPVSEGHPVVAYRTPLGGACSLMGACALAALAATLVIQREANNVDVVTSVLGMDSGTAGAAQVMPPMACPAAALTGIRVVVTAQGDGDGACVAPNAVTLPPGFRLTTLAHGALAQHVAECATCLPDADTAVRLELPWRCQSIHLQAFACAPSGMVSAVNLSATAGTGRLLSAVSWYPSPMLVLQRDTMRGLDARGHQLLVGRAEVAMTAATVVQPMAAGVQVTVSLAPPALYTSVELRERVTVLQLAASIVGLAGIFAAFGAASMGAEKCCGPTLTRRVNTLAWMRRPSELSSTSPFRPLGAYPRRVLQHGVAERATADSRPAGVGEGSGSGIGSSGDADAIALSHVNPLAGGGAAGGAGGGVKPAAAGASPATALAAAYVRRVSVVPGVRSPVRVGSGRDAAASGVGAAGGRHVFTSQPTQASAAGGEGKA